MASRSRGRPSGRPRSFSGLCRLGHRPAFPASATSDGTSTGRTTTHGIAGTSHPAVFKSQREGMAGYRFTVPDGRYRIELEFAELMGVGEFGRVMDISAEGQLRANNLDVAGQVGRWRALTTRFTARVHDGVLTVRFANAFGAPPILNGIRVTWLGS